MHSRNFKTITRVSIPKKRSKNQDLTALEDSKKENYLGRAISLPSSYSLNNIVFTASSSKLVRGKSEFYKKESKAISEWQLTVQKFIIQQQKSPFTLNQHKLTKIKYTEKDQAIKRFIVNELYSTEKSFYQFLNFTRNNYMEPMKVASQSKNPLVKPNDVYVLFNHLPGFLATSEKVLFKLEAYLRKEKIVGQQQQNNDTCPAQAIGQIFKELEQDFVIFLKYAIHYQYYMKAIRHASNTGYVISINNELRKLNKEASRLGLADYLISPFQRIPRYELLLKDLLKHTHEEDERYDLLYAKNIIKGLASTMNKLQEKIPRLSFSSSFYNFHTQSVSNLSM
ncbi:Dbl homology domain-containing protein [Cokeromyces recurvatus]|uniref:Dbl homology domain-containing protein n=1 Tax=Cokeromyces recurvatus TaxID=90255 RepID=UPI00221EB4C1|nr:Dbl homology domain-containing protein [Cokeromyces recurvatus]KAI7899602.1 Dbl homology domain-containing protein [Cokeromyces recurvatus]